MRVERVSGPAARRLAHLVERRPGGDWCVRDFGDREGAGRQTLDDLGVHLPAVRDGHAGLQLRPDDGPQFLHFTACPTHCAGCAGTTDSGGRWRAKSRPFSSPGGALFQLETILADSVPRNAGRVAA